MDGGKKSFFSFSSSFCFNCLLDFPFPPLFESGDGLEMEK